MDVSKTKGIAVFVAISLVLTIALVASVRWAHQRAAQYATPQTPATSQPQTESSAPIATPGKDVTKQPDVKEDKKDEPQKPAAALQPTPHSVPETGYSEVLFGLAGVSVAAYAASQLVQSRRKLLVNSRS